MNPGEKKIGLKDIPRMRVAFVSRTGPYSQIPEAMKTLMGWVTNRGIKPLGPPMVIYHNSPASVRPDELRWDIAIPVPDGVDGEDEIAVRELQGGKFVYALHQGLYEQVGAVYDELFTFIGQNSLRPTGPPMEIYLSDPGKVKPQDLTTEIRVPVAAAG
ncbi:MAG: GyrI-like domain-containing protein [Proteobacteria bacterium]|nr:GyrI-like domain-containing protein [Pseudomonadota bacterium]